MGVQKVFTMSWQNYLLRFCGRMNDSLLLLVFVKIAYRISCEIIDNLENSHMDSADENREKLAQEKVILQS